MNGRVVAMAIVGVLLTGWTGVGSAADTRTIWALRAFGGIATQSLDDWNDEIDSYNNIGIPVEFENLGAGFPFGAELVVRLAPQINVGVAVTHQEASASNSYADLSGSIAVRDELSLTTITGTIALAAGGGVFVGAEVGTGLGDAQTQFQFRDFGDPTNDLDYSGDWDGQGFMGGLFVGIEYVASANMELFAKAGYRFLDLGQLEGTVTSPQLGTASGPPFNLFTGEFKNTDFSGAFVVVGVGFGRFVR